MAGYFRDNYDLKIYQENLSDFLPDSIVDIHTHVYTADSLKYKEPRYWPDRVAFENTIEDLLQTYKDMLPDKKVIPVIFGNPLGYIEKNNIYCKFCADKHRLPALFLTHYNMTAEEIEKNVNGGRFSGIKPYFSNCKEGVNPQEADIYDFLPEEHLRIADKYGWKVMLHISKSKRLKDSDNIKRLMEIEQKYPNINLIVAHIGRAYAPEDVGNAFETLKHSKNIMFDFSANTLSVAMQKCIEAVGVKRVMFGSDMPITKMKMYRINENGDYINIVPKGLYGNLSAAAHMRESEEEYFTNFLYQQLLAFKDCATRLALTANDIKDIMSNNGAKLFDINLKGENI